MQLVFYLPGCSFIIHVTSVTEWAAIKAVYTGHNAASLVVAVSPAYAAWYPSDKEMDNINLMGEGTWRNWCACFFSGSLRLKSPCQLNRVFSKCGIALLINPYILSDLVPVQFIEHVFGHSQSMLKKLVVGNPETRELYQATWNVSTGSYRRRKTILWLM